MSTRDPGWCPGGEPPAPAPAPDTAPDGFAIPPVTGAHRGKAVQSAVVTPQGYDAATAIAVSGVGAPQISVAGGPWSASATIAPGQSFAVRATAAASYATAQTVTVTAGGVSAVWTVTTTAAPDTTPDAFAIPPLVGVQRGTAVQSAAVTPQGYEAATTITVSGIWSPQVSVAGGPWSASATIAPGQSFVVQGTSAAAFVATQTFTVTVGGVSAAWTVTTKAAPDTTPDAFTIAAATGALPGQVTTSASITPTGYDTTTSLSVNGAGTPQISVAGGAWSDSGTISPGQSFAVRTTAAAAGGVKQTVTVEVGGVAAAWDVTTMTCAGGSQLFTVSGTFTPPPACSSFRVLAVGGGGWGQRLNGGGSGYVTVGTVTATAPVAVTVGGAGQASAFGALVTAQPGGNGWYNEDQGGAGSGNGGSIQTAYSSTASGAGANGGASTPYPSFSIFKLRTFSSGAGGSAPVTGGQPFTSYVSGGGGGGLVISGATSPVAAAGSPGPLTNGTGWNWGREGGVGFGAGAGGTLGPTNTNLTAGAPGAVYVEW